jgi:MFS transporter, UMF1 family
MFDFANQAYTLLIITVIFGDLFTRVIVGDRGDDYRLGNLLWSLGLATSYLMVVVAAPLLGAIMDFSASRKQFLFGSYVLTILATSLLYFVAPGYIAWASCCSSFPTSRTPWRVLHRQLPSGAGTA